jgi:ABC-type uncharacterized transport system ATPase subunit
LGHQSSHPQRASGDGIQRDDSTEVTDRTSEVPVLETHNVSVFYGRAVEDVSLTVRKGEIVVIAGRQRRGQEHVVRAIAGRWGKPGRTGSK